MIDTQIALDTNPSHSDIQGQSPPPPPPPPSSEIFLALLLSKLKNKFWTFWKPTFC